MAVPGTFPQDFSTETTTADDDLYPFIKDPAGTPIDSNITPKDFLSSRGSLTLQGDWNANTNTPTLTSGVGPKGHFYQVTTPGSTDLDGITNWEIDDWAWFDGTAWQIQQSGGAALPTIGTNGEFATVAAAITANVFEMEFISDVIDTTDITPAANQNVTTALTTFAWKTGNLKFSASGTSIIKFSGDGVLETTVTSAGFKTFNMTATETLDLTGFREMDNSANSGASSGFYTGSSTANVLVENAKILLANGLASGFELPGLGSIFSNLNIVGGGSSCSGFIDNANGVIISNLSMEGTFNTTQGPFFMTFTGVEGSIVDNIVNTGSNAWIKNESAKSQFSNLTGNISIDLDISDNCRFTDSNLTDMDMTDASCSNNFFSGLTITNDVTIDGDNNRGINLTFTGNVVINGNNNHFILSTAASVVDNGTGNTFTNTGAIGTIWDRTGTVISPVNSGDDITTTGSVTGNKLITTGGEIGLGTTLGELVDTNFPKVNLTTTPEALQNFLPGSTYQVCLRTIGSDEGVFTLSIGKDAGVVFVIEAFNASNITVVQSPTKTFTLTVGGHTTVFKLIFDASNDGTLETVSGTDTGTTTISFVRLTP